MAKKFDISVVMRVIDKATGPLRRIGAQIGSTFVSSVKRAALALQKMQARMISTGRTMTTRLSLPIALFAGNMVRLAFNFQKSMNMVGAITKSKIGEQVTPVFEKLTRMARELGATTQFTASQAADGMRFLAMAGQSAAQILGGTLRKTLELAASAQLDMGSAADIVTNIMSSYQLKVGQLAEANDILVSTFTNANTDLVGLGEAFKFAGTVAFSAGIPMNQLAAAMALMSRAGLRGEMAGTALRNIITRLINPVGKGKAVIKKLGIQVWESAGKMRPLLDILSEFSAKGIGLADVLKLFRQRGGPAFQTLLKAEFRGKRGAKAMKEFLDIMKENVGITKRIAETQMSGLPGVLLQLKSAWEDTNLAIMDSGVGAFLEDIFSGVTKLLRGFSKLDPVILEFISSVAGLVAIAGPAMIAIGGLTKGMTLLGVAGGATVLLLGKVVLAILAIVVAWHTLDRIMTKLTKQQGITPDVGEKLGEKRPFIRSLGESTGRAFDIERRLKRDEEKARLKALDAFYQVELSPETVNKLAAATGKKEDTKAEIVIKVISDKGSTTTIESVKKKGGNTRLNILNDGSSGRTVPVFSGGFGF